MGFVWSLIAIIGIGVLALGPLGNELSLNTPTRIAFWAGGGAGWSAGWAIHVLGTSALAKRRISPIKQFASKNVSAALGAFLGSAAALGLLANIT